MRGQDAEDSEVRALTLLIQLFGRDAIEALSAAGFRDNEAIAGAGPERLSEAAGIPLSLARRIAAVAVEAHEVTATNAREGLMTDDEVPAVETEAPQAEAPPAVAAPSAEAPPVEVPSAERHVRRPLRRPHSRLVHPDVPAVPRHAAGGAGRKRGRERPAPQPAPAAPNTDPFIDDVGLVHWMGFAGRGGGTVPFSVADAILETVEDTASNIPATPPVLPETASTAPSAAAPAPDTRSVAPNFRSTTTATATQAPAAARVPASAPEPAPGALLKGSDSAGGSFWSFGRLLQSPGDTKREDPAHLPKGPTTPRRRTHDGH